jgi:4'-phosphopantetheinyl transferase
MTKVKDCCTHKAYLFVVSKQAVESSDQSIVNCAQAYARIAGLNLPHGIVIKRENGKPVFENLGGLHFSVSHSESLWACVVCDIDIGMDMQAHVRCNKEGVAKRFFHPLEVEYLEANGYAGFYDVWTAKESYVKLRGSGIDDGFGEFCVVAEGELAKRAGTAHFLHVRSIDGFSLCVCADSPLCISLVGASNE